MSSTTAATTPTNPLQQLQAIYPTLPAKLLQQLLDINNNDVSAAAEMLVQLMENQQKSKSSASTTAVQWDGSNASGEQMSRCQLYGTNASECGYCQHEPNAKGRVSFGLVTPKLQCSDYQSMIDVGWRRSGDYCYKPDIVKACCKQYTIRLDVHQFKPNKKQRQCLNRFERYIQTDQVSGEHQQQSRSRRNSQQSDDADAGATTHAKKQRTQSSTDDAAADTPQQQLQDDIHHDIMAAVAELLQLTKGSTASTLHQLQQQIKVYLPKPAKPSAAAAEASTADSPTVLSTNAALTLGKHLKARQQPLSDTVSQLVAILDRTNQRDNISYAVGVRGYINIEVASELWQTVASAEPPTTSRKSSPARSRSASNASQPTATPAHQWSVTHHPAQFTSEAYAVYKRYQIAVHGDKPEEVTEKGYQNFLCKTPLFVPTTATNHDRSAADDTAVQYGSFHTHYRIDGKLVAVGVVDILPSCLSSVYVYYDPEYDFLRLGTLTALLEIQRVKQQLSVHSLQLHYYYMGYYIHDCVKMRYKGEYEVSELLCPVRHTWHSLNAKVRAALDQSKFVVFSDLTPDAPAKTTNEHKQDTGEVNGYEPNQHTLADAQKQQLSAARRTLPTIPIVFRHQLQTYSALPSFVTKQLQKVLLEYVQLIGEAVAKRMAVMLD